MEFRILKSIGEELRNIRNNKNMPMSEVADKIGVSTVYISEIERDRKIPSDEVIEKLADLYNVKEVNLFEGFKRVPESINDEIINNKKLFEVLFDISTNEKLTKEQKEEFYSEIHKIYGTMFK